MAILTGNRASNLKEAYLLACQEAGIENMSADIIDMFNSVVESSSKISAETDKVIGSAVRSRYGNKATWRAERWFVPVPKLQYQGKDIHQLIIEVITYLVAVAVVRTGDDSRLITVAG